ncbi:MAG: ABC transporter permease subunit [Syntrophobacterales bacterium]|nr:ABC transporter permease subunit [Syntrophobacterales bacterium]
MPAGARALRVHRREVWFRGLCGAFAGISFLSVCTILGFLLYFTWPLVAEGHLARILAWHWRPFQGQFGILPMVAGSFCLAVSALAVAYPMGLGICCFAHGLGPRPLARVVMAVIHFMTSIPTVVYGFVAVFLLIPRIRGVFAYGTGFSWLAASLTLSLLILPTIVLLIHSQIRQVDPGLRLATASLGFTPAQELLWVLLPQSHRGLLAALVLGFARAVGDTLIALMLAGNAPQVPHSLLDAIRTMTAHIALVVATDSHSLAYHSIFACGLILFSLTVMVNLGLRWLQSPSSPGTRHEPHD